MSNLRVLSIVFFTAIVGVALSQSILAPMYTESSNTVHGQSLSAQSTTDDKRKDSKVSAQKANIPRWVKDVEKNRQQPMIEAKASRLTVHVKDRSLKAILDDIRNRTGIEIHDTTGLKHQLVSADFDNLTLTQGLRVLLKDQDSFFLFSDGTAAASLQSVWIYPKHAGRNIFPQIDQATRLEYGLVDPTPEVRIKAIASILQRQDDDAMEILIQALDDPDPEVRYETLAHARNVDLSPPVSILESMALFDPSQQVRQVALSHLTDNPSLDVVDAKAIAEQAMNDPNTGIQSIAMEIIQHIEAQQLSETESDW